MDNNNKCQLIDENNNLNNLVFFYDRKNLFCKMTLVRLQTDLCLGWDIFSKWDAYI